MAVITDELQTVLRLVGLGATVGAFMQIARVIENAVNAYADFDAQVLRTQFMMNQFGNAMPTGQVADFARQLSLTTGASQESIAELEAYLAVFRTGSDDIEEFTRVLTDAAMARGIPLKEIGQLTETALTGHARGLWRELGIQVKGVEGQLLSARDVMEIIKQHFGGFAAFFGQTLPGSLMKAGAAIKDLTIQFGRLFSPVLLGIMQLFARIAEGMANSFRAVADAFGIAGAGGGAAVANAAGGANRAQEQQVDYLQQISFNTGAQGPLVKSIGPASGSFFEHGAGLAIRDFNLHFKSAR